MVSINLQAHKPPRVDPALCKACKKCLALKACKSKALIQLDPGEIPSVDSSRCHGCYACVTECPFGAIVIPL
jgi:carbon-monoxide dehydrogenase iron sulfur subunit